MRFLTSYSVHPAEALKGLPDSHRFLVRDVELTLRVLDGNDTGARLECAVPADPAGLTLRTGEPPLDGSPPKAGIAVPEARIAGRAARSLARVLTFVLEQPMRIASSPGEALVPESSDDEAVLAELGNRPVYVDLRTKLTIQAPRFESLSEQVLEQLLDREVGLAIYQDALQMATEIGRYREFWRVLESAFGQKDTDLLAALKDYSPAVALEFDDVELRALLVLRGRASHAESSAGLEEYETVTAHVAEKLPRLKSIVEEVLLTKKSWGTRGLGVDRLAHLRTYVRKDGMPVLRSPSRNS